MVQAPEHVVLNAKALAKAGEDPKKRRKVVHKKPQEGTLTYTEATYDRLVAAAPEPLTSKMRVNHAMVLNVLDQWEGQQAALHTLLLDNHETPERREALVERAVQVLASLLRAKVVEPDDGSTVDDWLPADLPDAGAARPGRGDADAPSEARRRDRGGRHPRPVGRGPRPDRRAARRRRPPAPPRRRRRRGGRRHRRRPPRSTRVVGRARALRAR